MPEEFSIPAINASLSDEKEDHSSLHKGDEKREPERQSELGGRGETGCKTNYLNDDQALRTSEVISSFVELTRARLKSQTAKDYAAAFRAFAEQSQLDTMTRRPLRGSRGKVLVLLHFEKIPKTTWRWENAALKCAWTNELNLPPAYRHKEGWQEGRRGQE